jgi:hypothetical protein
VLPHANRCAAFSCAALSTAKAWVFDRPAKETLACRSQVTDAAGVSRMELSDCSRRKCCGRVNKVRCSAFFKDQKGAWKDAASFAHVVPPVAYCPPGSVYKAKGKWCAVAEQGCGVAECCEGNALCIGCV